MGENSKALLMIMGMIVIVSLPTQLVLTATGVGHGAAVLIAGLLGGSVGMLLGRYVAQRRWPHAFGEPMRLRGWRELREEEYRQLPALLVILILGVTTLVSFWIESTILKVAGTFSIGLGFAILGFTILTNRSWKWLESEPKTPTWFTLTIMLIGLMFVAYTVYQVVETV